MHTRNFLISIIFLWLNACQAAAPLPVTSPSEPPALPIKAPTLTARPLATITQPAVTVTPTQQKMSEEWLLWSKSPHQNTRKTVSCGVCHAGNSDNMSIQSGEKLCKSCHSNTEKASGQANPDEQIHSNFTCLNCHNPHSTQASCSNAGCHADLSNNKIIVVATPEDGHPFQAGGDSLCGGAVCHPQATQAALGNPTIHGSRHASVMCMACHDGSGAQVSRSTETGTWVLLQPTKVDGTLIPTTSMTHNIKKKVDCTRCHFDGNSWGLPLVTGQEFGN